MAELKPYKGQWGRDQILHLLRRSLFGVSIQDLKFFEHKTLDQCLSVLLTSPVPLHPDPPINAYGIGDTKDPDVPFGKVWVKAPKPIINDQTQLMNEQRRYSSLKGWWAGSMINQTRSLTEKMLIFWHNSIATQSYDLLDARYTYKHVVLLRQHALGSFKALIRDVIVDPCMLTYLNGNSNIKGTPNENFGRELQELFTIGKGKDSHFTEDDVKAAARILTGWRDDKDTVTSYFDADKHDTGDKTFSAFYDNKVIKGRKGKAGASETDELVNMLFKKEATARYLCRKLYRWFIHFDINEIVEEEVISPLSEVLIKSNFEIVPVLRALLSSEWFYKNSFQGHMIKSGVDYGIGLVRQFNVSFPEPTDVETLHNALYAVAGGVAQFLQDLGDPPSVAGWPAYYEAPSYYRRWVDANVLQFRRTVTAGFSSSFGLPSQGYTFKIDVIKFLSILSDPSDPDQLIKDSLEILLAMPTGENQKNFMRQILNNNQSTEGYWNKRWLEFEKNKDNLELRSDIDSTLRVLYTYILSLPEYQMM